MIAVNRPKRRIERSVLNRSRPSDGLKRRSENFIAGLCRSPRTAYDSVPMALRTFSLAQARRLALAAQGFDNRDHREARALARPAGRQALRRVMDRLHLLQLDSVPVITRTQYLPAYSRCGHYPHQVLDQIAYIRDEWFEAWAHEASLVPVRLEPLLRWQKQRARRGQMWRSVWQAASRESDYIARVLLEVRERGPVRACDLSDPRPRKVAGGWARGSLGAVALDWLFRVGELGIRRTGNFEKSFDVIDRIVPAAILNQPTPSEHEALAELLMLACKASGVATAEDLIDYFRLPVVPARAALNDLVHAGCVARCEVQGWAKPAYHLPDVRLPRTVHARALLSPFDPVVWYRDRAERLFNFEHRLEIYTPERKRRWGYYVLPFLMGEQIVARVDLKNDRPASVLRVPAAHLEAGHDAHQVADSLAAELRLLAHFLGASRIVVGRRGNLIDMLRLAVRASS